MADDSGRLIPLGTASDDEATVYVKGFLGCGESPEHFESWHRAHRALVESHGWAPTAHGWAWTSGTWRAIPMPLASGAKLAVDAYRSLRYARVAALGATAGLAVAEVAARFLVQYRAAERSAIGNAGRLACELRRLARTHARVRVVAHSLGCRQVVEAAARLAPAHRPWEIHLCAPAFPEAEVGPRLPRLARVRTCLYYSPYDLVLGVAYPLVSWQRALGAAGPETSYAGVEAVDVSRHFGFWVHAEYKNRFADLVRHREAS